MNKPLTATQKRALQGLREFQPAMVFPSENTARALLKRGLIEVAEPHPV